jgi:hypothetical protein
MVFLLLGPDRTVSITNSCANAVNFALTNDHRLTADGLYAFVPPANVTAGSSHFTFGQDNPANIEGNFSSLGGDLMWSNPAFSGGQAIFGFPSSGVGLVIVIFNGSLPPGYSAPTFSVLMTGSQQAAAGMCSPLEALFR